MMTANLNETNEMFKKDNINNFYQVHRVRKNGP